MVVLLFGSARTRLDYTLELSIGGHLFIRYFGHIPYLFSFSDSAFSSCPVCPSDSFLSSSLHPSLCVFSSDLYSSILIFSSALSNLLLNLSVEFFLSRFFSLIYFSSFTFFFNLSFYFLSCLFISHKEKMGKVVAFKCKPKK